MAEFSLAATESLILRDPEMPARNGVEIRALRNCGFHLTGDTRHMEPWVQFSSRLPIGPSRLRMHVGDDNVSVCATSDVGL